MRCSKVLNKMGNPEVIEIQTASYCNGKCIICPHEHVSKFLPQGVMSMGLFKKIIIQVKDTKRIIPYFNNEPFLDPLFIERLKLIRKNCKNVEIEIATNVSLLDKRMQAKLRGIKIDELRLSIFGFTPNTFSKIMKGLDWRIIKKNLDTLVKNKKLRKNIKEISIVMIDFPIITKKDKLLAKRYCKKHSLTFNLWGFLDRSRNVKNYSNNIFKSKINGCEQDRPLKRMHITFDGKVILCCMDWKQEHVLGDLNKKSIKSVWNSKKYNTIRQRIYNSTTKAPNLCGGCKIAK